MSGVGEGLLSGTSPSTGVLARSCSCSSCFPAQISDSLRSRLLTDLPFEQDGQRWREWLTDDVIERLPRVVQDTIQANRQVTMFNFAGPALKAILPSTAVYWPFAILFPFAVCWGSSCPEGAHPFAHYPVVVWVPVLVVVFSSMYWEWKGLRWIIYTLARYLAPFKVFFGLRVTICAWLMMVFGMSFISHLDVATNGLFLAKMLKTLYCDRPTTTAIRRLWERVINNSSVKDVPGFKNLSVIMLLSWGVMLFQPLVCFLCTYPLEGLSKTNYEPAPPTADGTEHPTNGHPGGYRTPWLCCSETKIWHPDALQTVATANRMVSITDKALQWWLARGHQHLHANDVKGRIRACENLQQMLDINVKRNVLVNLLEKSWMLEAQTTIFAVSRCLMPRDSELRFDGQMLISLCLSFITFTKTLYDMVDQHFMILAFWHLARREDNLPPSVANSEVGRLRRTKHRVRRVWVWFILTFLFLVGFFTHCFTKLVMAFICEDSLWNIPFSHKPHQDWRGCVDVSDFLPPWTEAEHR